MTVAHYYNKDGATILNQFFFKFIIDLIEYSKFLVLPESKMLFLNERSSNFIIHRTNDSDPVK